MATKTKPRDWENESDPFAVAKRKTPGRKAVNYLTEQNRRKIINDHLPGIRRGKKSKSIEGIEAAVQKFRLAKNFDKRPLPTHVEAKLHLILNATKNLKDELSNCDDFTMGVIKYVIDRVPPSSPLPSGLIRKEILESLHVAMTPDQPDGLLGQLEQYDNALSGAVKKVAAKKGERRRKGSAFPILVAELVNVWEEATGNTGKNDLKCIKFIEVVMATKPVREVEGITEETHKKIKNAMRNL